MERVILHCDMNGFFASVEGLEHPELRDKPFAVCGDPESRHGIILAKNEIAKQYHIKTAETIWQAQRKCPQLILLRAHHEKYEYYSGKANEIYLEYTDRVEPCSIDESWLDVTESGRLFGNGREIADTLRQRMRQELGLTISVGVSFNKIFAKMGSDYQKPDATTEITRRNYKQLLYPLPVSELILVGRSAEEKLKTMGITTIGQLAECNVAMLKRALGKMGETIHAYANGVDLREVAYAEEQREAKSIGNSMTFQRDLRKTEEVRAGVLFLADTVASRLRASHKKCTTVQIVLRDPDFHDRSRQKKLPQATNLATEIAREATELILSIWKPGMPIRLISVTAAQLQSEEQAQQLTFWENTEGEKRKKLEHLERAMDGIRERYGKDSVKFAGAATNDVTEKTEN